VRTVAIKTLERRFRPPARRAWGVRFSFDDPETIRVLPSEWTDRSDKTIGIHRSVPIAGMDLERFPGNFMDMLKDSSGGDSRMYAWAAVFSNLGLLYGPDDELEIFRITG